MPYPNSKTTGDFEIRGINHLALVCKDMARTVDFYTNILGFPLIKTVPAVQTTITFRQRLFSSPG